MENVQQMENEEITAVVADRDRLIVRTSIIGIITNVFLAAFKAAIGLLSHSIAVVLDAVNNLSDALSSLITIIGTKLSAKLPDKKHPLGYGRIEYLTALAQPRSSSRSRRSSTPKRRIIRSSRSSSSPSPWS